MRKRLILAVFFAVLFAVAFEPALYAQFNDNPDLATTTRNGPYTAKLAIKYYEGPEFDPLMHTLDVYIPEGAEDAPVLYFLHGGGWRAHGENVGAYSLARSLVSFLGGLAADGSTNRNQRSVEPSGPDA